VMRSGGVQSGNEGEPEAALGEETEKQRRSVTRRRQRLQTREALGKGDGAGGGAGEDLG
jgi:hypothetical protein